MIDLSERMSAARALFAVAAASQRPHVILLLADDLGFGDVGFQPAVRPVPDAELPFTPNVDAMARGEGIEIRGFGSFSLHYRPGRVGRNPKTGAPVSLPAKYVPHFKPGKELRDRVNKGLERDRMLAAAESADGTAPEAAAAEADGSPTPSQNNLFE